MVRVETLPVITVASAGTAVQVSSTATPVTTVTIQAEFTNVGRISVGDSTVLQTTGIELSPGDTICITADMIRSGSEEFSISELWLNSSTSGNKARALVFRRKP